MSDNDKNRIKIKLPAVSYDIVKLAATLTGTSVKSFAAQAVINAALHVTAEIENRSLGSNIEADIHLTEEEAQALLALVESLDTHDGKDEDVEEATAEDFEDTMKLVEEVGFDASFSFIYSPRPGTPAARLPDDTPYDVKLARLQRLQATIDANATRISESMLGTEQRVLVLGPARKGEGFLMARTDNNRIVNFEGPLSLVDTMVRVKVTDVYPHSLGGQLLD